MHHNWTLPPWNHSSSACIIHGMHFGMMHQLDADACPMVEAHYHINNQHRILEKLHGETDVGPTCGFIASPEVGQGATVGTMQTGHPHVQASKQDKGQDMHPRAAICHRSSRTCPPPPYLGGHVTCSKAPDPTPPPRRAPALPRVLGLWTPPHHLGGLRRSHTSLSTGILPTKEQLEHFQARSTLPKMNLVMKI
jgi:hypothetical protein